MASNAFQEREPEISCDWLGTKCCEFVVHRPLSPLLFRRLAHAAERLRFSNHVDSAVASYATVAVYWHQTPREADDLEHRIRRVLCESLMLGPDEFPKLRRHTFRVEYDGEDLVDVARHSGLTVSQVIKHHASPSYVVAAIGFMPSFAYLWGLADEIATPRRASPRTRVPAGAVGIADGQTGVYPCRSPGGWQLIGQVDDNTLRNVLPCINVGDEVCMASV